MINYFIPQSKLPEAPDGGGDVQLVAVSKFQSNEAIMAAYEAGQRVFGENYVQELVAKAPVLPADIRWHFIGTLQSNKAKGLIAGACITPHSLCLSSLFLLTKYSELNTEYVFVNRQALRTLLSLKVFTVSRQQTLYRRPARPQAVTLLFRFECMYVYTYV